MKHLEWHTETRKISDLIPFEGNPRQMTEAQAKDLEKSLRKFNLVEIPAINMDGVIIAGHQRINILIAQGRAEEDIEVRIPNRKLTEAEFREYNLRSNKNLGEWDWAGLTNFDAEMLLDVGFSAQDIAKGFGLGDLEDIGYSEEQKLKLTVTYPREAQAEVLAGIRQLCGEIGGMAYYE